jgi:putative ABC transport system permease protein
MPMFNMESEIRSWKKTLRGETHLQDADAAELESHLRDEIDQAIKAGLDPEAAFREAVARSASADALGREYGKFRPRSARRPFWHPARFLPALAWNTIKFAIRFVRRKAAQSLIGILSLAVGMACSALIFFFIRDERSYDRFHPRIDRIHHLGANIFMGNMMMIGEAPTPLAPTLPGQFPEIAAAVRLTREERVVKSERATFKQKGLAADPGFLEMFSFPLKNGVPKSVLADPQAVILSEDAAALLFGKGADPVGRPLSIRIDDRYREYRIAAVAGRIPANSSLRFDFLVNLAGIYGSALDKGGPGLMPTTFIELVSTAKAGDLAGKFRETIDKGWTAKHFDKKSGYRLEALADYHLRGANDIEVLVDRSRAVYSRILSAIAVLILMIAGFNFMNLSLGNAAGRFKEIGVRKVLGSSRAGLIRQFCLEAVLTCEIALLAGLLLARLLLPVFNAFAQKNLRLDLFGPGQPLLIMAAAAGIFGLASGCYPALVLSRFNTASLFNRSVRFTGKNTFSRVLIVLQFAIAVFMIVAALVMARQNSYLLHESLGFNAAQVAAVPFDDLDAGIQANGSFYSAFKQKLGAAPQIGSVAGAAFPFAQTWQARGPKLADGKHDLVTLNVVDADFLPTMGLRLLQGRNFSPSFPADKTDAVIVNRAFVDHFGLSSPLDRDIATLFTDNQGLKGRIIGVVEDFHSQSLREKIQPTVLMLGASGDFGLALVKIDGRAMKEALDAVRREFNSLAPEIPFRYSFVDDDVARQYAAESRWGKMIALASIFTVFIACSGLFGLTLVAVARRTKEIGIRRVLGASIGQVTRLVNGEFIRLVLLANVIGWPVAYWGMKTLLKNYAYRVSISPLVFLLAGGLAAAISILTISVHAVRISFLNPAKTLRTE